MTSLNRLLQLVQRTQLPTVIQSTEGGEVCVVLPLALYERLVGGEVSQTIHSEASLRAAGPPMKPQGEESPFLETLFSAIPPTGVQVALEGGESPVRLQDLLGFHQQKEENLGASVPFPRTVSEGDRFAFDGLDVRILPHSSQKMSLRQDSLDEL